MRTGLIVLYGALLTLLLLSSPNAHCVGTVWIQSLKKVVTSVFENVRLKMRDAGYVIHVVAVALLMIVAGVGVSAAQSVSYPGGSVTWGDYDSSVSYPGGNVNWGPQRGSVNVPGAGIRWNSSGGGRVNINLPGVGFRTNIRW